MKDLSHPTKIYWVKVWAWGTTYFVTKLYSWESFNITSVENIKFYFKIN